MPPDQLKTIPTRNGDSDHAETREWLDSLEAVLQHNGPARARFLLGELEGKALRNGVELPFTANTPYINTIPREHRQPPFPGSREIERRIKSLVRWNAMAMVVRANKRASGIGGHISTYASLATLLEIGFNHFFRGPDAPGGGDQVYFQGHAAPGIYARAFLEGRLKAPRLANFRRELGSGGGLSSYPHPWLMPHFWQFPTVSMGLTAIQAIYQARFNRYLLHRGLKDTAQQRVWAFLGDGETDEPESLGALTLASRERLDNLVFVVNCNLQRLDGPVRGNGKIIQELEAAFRGAGWNVIKVIWGGESDALLARDKTGLLVQRMGEVVDGEYQKYTVESGAYIREHFFGKYPELLKLVEHLSDEQLRRLDRGGHDPEKVYAAFKAATEHTTSPTVILAKTIKGYGLGEAGEGRNVTHQQKKLNEDELKEFRTRFGIPISDEDAVHCPFYRPPDDSREVKYMTERRNALGGCLPQRRVMYEPLPVSGRDLFKDFLQGSGSSEFSTTMVFVGMLKKLLIDKVIGQRIVPIIPDEASTFGMDALFKPFGIYSNVGQLYEPVDAKTLLAYREAKNGQLLEEGITEAGAMSSFIASATSYATHGFATVPFFIYYSMFGFQRIGDLIWAAADLRPRGFLLGGTAGRTTLNGEGLQHEDGHSHVLASTVPNVMAYDPAFAFELAFIIQEGMRRMYEVGEDIFYYITLYNENYPQAAMPDGAADGVLRGMYKLRPAVNTSKLSKVHLLGSGPLVREALRAQEILAERYEVAVTFVGDPVGLGLVASLARPGGNVTGFSNIVSQLTPKRLELLAELVPQAGVIALLVNPNSRTTEPLIPDMQEAARTKGVQLHVLKAGTESEIDAAFATIVELHADGLVVAGDPFIFSRRDQLVALASRHAVPAIYPISAWAEAGGLISYGTSLAAVMHQVGSYSGRILKGAKPADLPVQQPTTFQLVVNLKTAKALGLTVPPSILARADEVIE